MVIEETFYIPDYDICPVEQTNSISVSQMINSGTVPNLPMNDEFAELDHSSIYGRPSDVFEAMGMQEKFIAAGQAAAMATPADSES